MSTVSILKELSDWFADRPEWMQAALLRISKQGSLTQQDLQDLLLLCKSEASSSKPISQKTSGSGVAQNIFQPATTNASLQLLAISSLQGVNALAPRTPLEIGQSRLSIVYGRNGSGKSGYVRALKHASGARNPGELLGNVFVQASQEASCLIKCMVDGTPTDFSWSMTKGPIQELKAIQVYDTETGCLYVTTESEVAYEPELLGLFTKLTEACGSLNALLDAEIRQKVSSKPAMPAEFQGSSRFEWYATLTPDTNDGEISKRCAWTSADEARLTELIKRLAEKDPSAVANQLRKRAYDIDNLANELENRSKQLSDQLCQSHLTLRDKMRAKRKAADDDATKVFTGAPLIGIGTESWKLLWDHARKYAETEAYKGLPFPNVGPDARCVLCQQPLAADAKEMVYRINRNFAALYPKKEFIVVGIREKKKWRVVHVRRKAQIGGLIGQIRKAFRRSMAA